MYSTLHEFTTLLRSRRLDYRWRAGSSSEHRESVIALKHRGDMQCTKQTSSRFVKKVMSNLVCLETDLRNAGHR